VTFLFADHAVALVETGARALGWDPAPPRPEASPIPSPAAFLTAATLIVLTWINVRGVVLSTRVAVAFTSAKFLALAAIVVLALVIAGLLDPSRGSVSNFAAAGAPMPLLAAIPAVMAGVLWTYDGWNDVAAVSGEVVDPRRTLPRVLVSGIAAVTLIYLAVNAVYFWLIPIQVQRTLGDSIGPAVLTHLLGPVGGVLMTALIVVSTLGSSHASVLANARVSFAQARDGLLFHQLGAVHPRFGTPHVSLWVGGIMGAAAAWFQGSFVALAGTFVFTMWIFYAMAAGAVIVLRVRRPLAPRPYRCPGYPVVPALFVLAAAFMTVMAVVQDVEASGGVRTLPWLGVLLAGWPVYLVWKRWVRST
jgi:APA family basic amino acid/polyamine antiporter